MKDQSTVILVFSQQADQEVLRKQWTGPGTVSLKLLGKWNQKALRLAKNTKAPVLLSSDLIDHQGSFHEQISRAFDCVFALGYEKIICIGNDCPGLRTSTLATAIDMLESGSTVLGPDRRGGVYLIGIDKERWKMLEGAQIPWQKEGLFDHLYQMISGLGNIQVLDKLNDIHSTHEVRSSWLAGELTLNEMLQWQKIIVAYLNIRPLVFILRRSGTLLKTAATLRGPPMSIPSL